MESGVPTNCSKLPSNIRITSLPSTHLDFEDALREVINGEFDNDIFYLSLHSLFCIN